MESPNNILRSTSTTKWLRSRHTRTSSLIYLHSPQICSALQDVDQVFHHFARKDLLDFRAFRLMFTYVNAEVPGELLYALYQCLPPGEQRSVTQKQFREAFGPGAFTRKFSSIIEELRRKGGSWPTTPLAFMSLIADKVSERKMEQDARTVTPTQNSLSGLHFQRLSALLELVKKRKVEMPEGCLPYAPPRFKNAYLEEVKERLKLVDMDEEGSKSPVSSKSRSPKGHRRTQSLRFPFII